MSKKGCKFTIEHKKKISLALKGRKHSQNIKDKISQALKGNIPWNKNKKVSQIAGQKNPNWKGGKPKCLDCGKIVSSYGCKRCQQCNGKIHVPPKAFKKGIIPWNKGKKGCMVGLCWKGRKHPSGRNSFNWKGGITPIDKLIRCSEKYADWRQRIFIRDDFTCQKCKRRGGELHAHHIKSFSKLLEEVRQNLPLYSLYDGAMVYTPLWDTDNGITLCKKCHIKIKM